MMMCLVIYWMIASVYGTIVSYWRPEEMKPKVELIASVYGINIDTVWFLGAVIAGFLWPVCMPGDVVFIINKFTKGK